MWDLIFVSSFLVLMVAANLDVVELIYPKYRFVDFFLLLSSKQLFSIKETHKVEEKFARSIKISGR